MVQLFLGALLVAGSVAAAPPGNVKKDITYKTTDVGFLQERCHELKSEWYIPSVVDEMIKYGEMSFKVLDSEAKWFGVTYPEDKPSVMTALKDMHQTGEYPARLWG